jgi:uncharacterized protein YraI
MIRTTVVSRLSSAVTTIRAVPGDAFAVTRPLDETVALSVSKLLQDAATVTVGSATTDATNCTDWVTMIATESGIDVTDWTPITVAVDVPVTPKAVAEIVEVPRFNAVT